ncbi:hypothetical protein E2C06_34410 [Dankookia rubra]|uniref:Uncharacterized protein n=1 Tax=Dankookia rubra TaxID=1442381 RepID=A0A4R5Q5B2_9PROT|nr:hypothetical protein [Dankookia rubra]TDH58094.1 hypothetical protein E2C06_34410 [Dankookia rubra]
MPPSLPQVPPPASLADAPGRTALDLAPPQAIVVLAAGRDPVALLRGLCALAVQRNTDGLFLAAGAFGVVLVPNGPAATVEGALDSLGPSLPFPVRVTPPVPAGDWALRAGLDAALGWGGPEAVLLTTEAGAVPEARWVARAVAALAAGRLDAVLGQVVPPAGTAASDAAARYAAALAAMAALIDPDPADAEPGDAAHGQAAAASFAIRGAVLRSLGGLPIGPEGGLAGLLAALHRRDGRIRHLEGMRVEASQPPQAIEPAMAAWRRLRARRAVRGFWTAGIGVFERETAEFRRWAARLGLSAGALGAALSASRFGEAWAAVSAASPVLADRSWLPHSALPREILRARLLLAAARLVAPAAARPAASPASPA